MSKQKKKKAGKGQVRAPEQEIAFDLNIPSRIRSILPFVFCIIPVFLGIYYINYAFSINRQNGFPIDDPWIHLTFARNIAEFGSYSYFKNEIVTSGSTSPLYTLLLAVGFFITKNEMILSYALGILFLVVSVVVYYYYVADNFRKDNWLIIGAVLLFATDKWMNFIAVSGMETTMYIFILVSAAYFYYKRNAIGFGVMIGLVMWARPDGIAFFAALIIDYFLFQYFAKSSTDKNNAISAFTKKDFVKIGSIFGIFTIAYFIFNLKLSGSLLPNTFNAKLAYYSPEFRSRASFLQHEVWEYFTDSAYILFIVPFAVSVGKVIFDSSKKCYNRMMLPILFALILIFIYAYKLPYAHRFGRYLMPIIPFYILLFVYGSREIIRFFYRTLFKEKSIANGLNVILIAVAIVWTGADFNKKKEQYQDQTHHIAIRQIAAAKWLKENTPPGSVIAVHDVGAIGYYSDRKIIDVAGLINPELIGELMDQDYNKKMAEEMKKRNVGYTAFLKEWYQVVNENPLFIGGDNNYEIIEIYKFDPQKTHILSVGVNSDVKYGIEFLNNKQYQQALSIFSQVVRMDTLSSLTYYMLACTESLMGNNNEAEKNLKKALNIFPGYIDANFALTSVYNKMNRKDDARALVQGYIQKYPADTATIRYLKNIIDTVKTR